MNRIMLAVGAALAVGLAPQFAGAYTHMNRAGGSTSHAYGEGTEHTNAWGGDTAHAWGGGTEHTNVYGGHTEGEAGYGAEHTNMYGGTTAGAYGEGAVHTTPYGATAYAPPPADAYAYHPPTSVNYYGEGCYNCGGSFVRAGCAGECVQRGCCRRRIAGQCDQRVRCGVRGWCCGGCRGCFGADHVRDGQHLPVAAAGLHQSDRARQHVLPLRQHVVPAELRRERRVLQGRSGALTGPDRSRRRP